MNKPRHYKEEFQSIADYDKRKEARVREKRLFMERWGLLPAYETFFSECSLHEVEVQLKNMQKEHIPTFIKKEFGTYYELLEVRDHYVRLLYFLDSSYDPAEIDVVLYYIFGDYELGVYHSYHIN